MPKVERDPTVIPRNLTVLAVMGEELVRSFCILNLLPVPPIRFPERKDFPFDTQGYYRPDTTAVKKWSLHGGGIVVCVDRCSLPAGESVDRNWSWPGNIIDQTPYGVIAHELGHHVDWLTGEWKGTYFSDYCEQVKEESREKGVTSYAEKNPAEWFAEGFRLFLTNPDLLFRFRPRLYSILRKRWQPPRKGGWLETLGANVPDRVVRSIRSKGVK